MTLEIILIHEKILHIHRSEVLFHYFASPVALKKLKIFQILLSIMTLKVALGGGVDK